MLGHSEGEGEGWGCVPSSPLYEVLKGGGLECECGVEVCVECEWGVEVGVACEWGVEVCVECEWGVEVCVECE